MYGFKVFYAGVGGLLASCGLAELAIFGLNALYRYWAEDWFTLSPTDYLIVVASGFVLGSFAYCLVDYFSLNSISLRIMIRATLGVLLVTSSALLFDWATRSPLYSYLFFDATTGVTILLGVPIGAAIGGWGGWRYGSKTYLDRDHD